MENRLKLSKFSSAKFSMKPDSRWRILLLWRSVVLKKSLVLATFAIGTAMAQHPSTPQARTPLDSVPPPLVGALMDLYTNYQQNRPQLPLTPQSAARRVERTRNRNTKVATGVAIGAAVGALIADRNDRGKAAAIGAVAGGLASLLLDQLQAKRQENQQTPYFDDSYLDQATK